MTRNVIIFVTALCAAVLISGGCKKSDDSMALLGALGGPEVYAGSNPDGNFIEISIDRKNQTVDYTDFTAPVNNLTDLAYVWLDPGVTTSAGGFTILYRAELPAPFSAGDHVLFAEIPGVAVTVAILNGADEMLEPPMFAFKRKDVTQRQYYEKAFNWLHVTVDDEGGKPDVMCGFVASDSSGTPTPNGRLYGAEYSIQDNATTNLNDPPVMAVGNLEKDAESGAFVAWLGAPLDWADAIVMIGDPASAAQIIFGANQGGGGAFTVPQASTKDFQSAYAGTYAAIEYQFDKGTGLEAAGPATVVVTATGHIKVFGFGADTTNDANLIFNEAALMSVEEYGAGALIIGLNTTSLLNDATVGASYAGIAEAFRCHGAFIAPTQNVLYGEDATIVVLFDPEGRFAGFHIFDCDELVAGTDDILSFGLAIKDNNFINP